MNAAGGFAETLARLSARLAELGVRPDGPFQTPDVMAEALTHGSFATEHGRASNQRLELLGDAVLGLAVAELLFDLFPQADEGVLSKLRASFVDEESLAREARVLDLGPLLAMDRGEDRSGGRERNSVLADAFEAVLAGLYRSEGLPVVRALIEKLFKQEAMERGVHGRQPDDYKTALQVRAQAAWKASPTYRIVGESGPDHDRIFTAEVGIGPVAGGRGEGRTKRSAEQQAARATLESWDQVAAAYEAARSAVAAPPTPE